MMAKAIMDHGVMFITVLSSSAEQNTIVFDAMQVTHFLKIYLFLWKKINIFFFKFRLFEIYK